MAWFNSKKNNPPPSQANGNEREESEEESEEDFNEFENVIGFDNDTITGIDNDTITGIDTSNGINYGKDNDLNNNAYDDSDELNNDANYDDYSEPSHSNNEAGIISPSFQQPSTVIQQYRQIDSAQQGYNLIAGIEDVPLRYKDQNLLPELVAISLQYNNFAGNSELAEWQIKGRGLIRKYQMNHSDNPLDGRFVAGITYINDMLIWRGKNGFERKMCNNNLTGVIEENGTESSPRANQPQKRKSFLSSMFGGN